MEEEEEKERGSLTCGEQHQGHASHARFLARPPAESGKDVTDVVPTVCACLNQRATLDT
jgi:hypothetical protein